MKSHLSLLIPISAIAVSCAPETPPITEAEALARLDPKKWVVEDNIPMESTAGVSNRADIKAYPVGRYVDPANPNVMHERHVIYRRENSESWRRDTDRGNQILLGPTVGLRNPIARRNPASQELSAELNRQKLVTRRLLAVEKDAREGDLRAAALLREARDINANQEIILGKLNEYERARNAEKEALEDRGVPVPADPEPLIGPTIDPNPFPDE